MLEKKIESTKPLAAYLLGIRRWDDTAQAAQDHLAELTELVATMGMPVAGSEMAGIQNPTPQFLVGSGKAESVKAAAEMAGADLIIVDDELTPAQQRNWEKLTEKAVIDRREVILDIFAQRARTREARLQVDLARLQYSLPRLKRAWTHLERQRGGGSMMGGAGEAQIEVDRRIVRENIQKIKEELVLVRRQRANQRKTRLSKPVPTAAIVGYTNAGKSSLLNHLTGAAVLEENKLFATLDPTTRRLGLPSGQEMLLTDTVGFIRKLPHQFVEAFMATLEEASLADLLLHVLDASHPAVLEHLKASRAVLEELKANERPTLYILNKMDLVTDELALAQLRNEAQPHVLTSTLTGQGLPELRAWLDEFVARDMSVYHVRIPASRYDLISFLHREATIKAEAFDDADVLMTIQIEAKHLPKVQDFVVPEDEAKANPPEDGE